MRHIDFVWNLHNTQHCFLHGIALQVLKSLVFLQTWLHFCNVSDSLCKIKSQKNLQWMEYKYEVHIGKYFTKTEGQLDCKMFLVSFFQEHCIFTISFLFTICIERTIIFQNFAIIVQMNHKVSKAFAAHTFFWESFCLKNSDPLLSRVYSFSKKKNNLGCKKWPAETCDVCLLWKENEFYCAAGIILIKLTYRTRNQHKLPKIQQIENFHVSFYVFLQKQFKKCYKKQPFSNTENIIYQLWARKREMGQVKHNVLNMNKFNMERIVEWGKWTFFNFLTIVLHYRTYVKILYFWNVGKTLSQNLKSELVMQHCTHFFYPRHSNVVTEM